MTNEPGPIARTLDAWRKANREADERGREVLDAIRSDLDRLNALASEAKKEGRRGGLSKEADDLEAAIRNARSAVTPAGREADEKAGESTDPVKLQEVRAAREKEGAAS